MLIIDNSGRSVINFDNVSVMYIDGRQLRLRTTDQFVECIEFKDNIGANVLFKQLVAALVAGEKVFYLNGVKSV